jgi:hypothetical protein
MRCRLAVLSLLSISLSFAPALAQVGPSDPLAGVDLLCQVKSPLAGAARCQASLIWERISFNPYKIEQRILAPTCLVKISAANTTGQCSFKSSELLSQAKALAAAGFVFRNADPGNAFIPGVSPQDNRVCRDSSSEPPLGLIQKVRSKIIRLIAIHTLKCG